MPNSTNASNVYCPQGSAAPRLVQSGYFSTGPQGAPHQRSGEQRCPRGTYCEAGIKFPCPPGCYGDTEAQVLSSCTGPCSNGYQCVEGSSSPTAAPCDPGFTCVADVRAPCPAGYWSAGQAVACTPCSAGQFSATPAATSAATCQPCPVHPGALIDEGSSPGAATCWPGVLYVNASNPPPLRVGFSVGDVVLVAFTKATNTPARPVEFQPDLGALAFSWQGQGSVLLVRMVDGMVGGVAVKAFDVDIGKVRGRVVGVTDQGGSAAPTPLDYVPVGGTWGVPGPPTIASAVACDSGRGLGLGVNDTLVVTFDQEVGTGWGCFRDGVVGRGERWGGP
jgi:hypothetical protein